MLKSMATIYSTPVSTPAFLMPSLNRMRPKMTAPIIPMTAIALITLTARSGAMPTSMLRATSWVIMPIWASIRKPVDRAHSQVSLVRSSLPVVQPELSSSGGAEE